MDLQYPFFISQHGLTLSHLPGAEPADNKGYPDSTQPSCLSIWFRCILGCSGCTFNNGPWRQFSTRQLHMSLWGPLPAALDLGCWVRFANMLLRVPSVQATAVSSGHETVRDLQGGAHNVGLSAAFQEMESPVLQCAKYRNEHDTWNCCG